MRSLIYTAVLTASLVIAIYIYDNYNSMIGSTLWPEEQISKSVESHEPAKSFEERLEESLAQQEAEEKIAPITITCDEIEIYNHMYLQCVNSGSWWGRWEVYIMHVNGQSQHIWSTVYNDSTGGGPFTTDPMDIMVVFFHLDGRVKEYLYHTKNTLKDCTISNLCVKVM